MLRNILAAIILIPLAVLIIAFAVANRQVVTISFDPFNTSEPAAAVTLPLFAMFILALVVGVLIGGVAAWIRQGRWRRSARRLEQEVRELHEKIDALEVGSGASTIIPDVSEPPQRLKLRPPVR